MRDAESLPAVKLRVRQCPPVDEFDFQHFMTTSTRKNGLLMYDNYRRVEYVIPIALVRGIDRINV